MWRRTRKRGESLLKSGEEGEVNKEQERASRRFEETMVEDRKREVRLMQKE
jgi:hypothetical protein